MKKLIIVFLKVVLFPLAIPIYIMSIFVLLMFNLKLWLTSEFHPEPKSFSRRFDEEYWPRELKEHFTKTPRKYFSTKLEE